MNDLDLSEAELNEMLDGVPVAAGAPVRSQEDDVLGGGPLSLAEEAQQEEVDREDATTETHDPGSADEPWVEDLFRDEPPTVPELFANWSELFRKRPFVRLTQDPRNGSPVLLLGYGYRRSPDGAVLLDNARLDGTLVRDLVSICQPFTRSNDEDTKGVKVVIVPARKGSRLRAWRALQRANGVWEDKWCGGFVVTDRGLKRDL